MCTNPCPPDPASPAFEFWVRAQALDAASRVIAGLAGTSSITSADVASGCTMALAERFERRLNFGAGA